MFMQIHEWVATHYFVSPDQAIVEADMTMSLADFLYGNFGKLNQCRKSSLAKGFTGSIL